MTREIIRTEAAPAAIGPYSQGVRSGSLVYTAGQIGLDPVTGLFTADDAAGQARRCLQNAEAVVRAGGLALDDVVKVTIFLRSMDDFSAVNAVYEEFFAAARPARSTVAVSGLPKDARVEIEMIAVAP
jgi:2-iminobutanoate/2-iminopropanoate deaminase